MSIENQNELKKIAESILPPEVALQIQESLKRKGMVSSAVKKGIAAAQPKAEEEFKALFDERNVVQYVESFFEKHMNSMILGFIGFEDSWHSGLQPKSNDFEKTAMYRFFQNTMEETAKKYFLEHFSDRMADLRLTQKQKDKIVSSYRDHLGWEIERIVRNKAKADAEKILFQLIGVDPSEGPDDE